jgi:hypothetical protein
MERLLFANDGAGIVKRKFRVSEYMQLNLFSVKLPADYSPVGRSDDSVSDFESESIGDDSLDSSFSDDGQDEVANLITRGNFTCSDFAVRTRSGELMHYRGFRFGPD